MAVFVLACMLIVVFCSSAKAADTVKMKYWFYDSFNIQTPDNWKAQKDGSSVSFFNADESAYLMILVEDRQGKESSRELAEANLANVDRSVMKDDGNGLKLKDNGDGLFTYSYIDPDGNKWRHIIGVVAYSMIQISMAGEDPNMEAALKTLKLKVTFVPNVKSLL
jgi:hypothetical protein